MKEMYRVKRGGLMRCCLLTLDDSMVARGMPPDPGERLKCRWCPSYMIFVDGSWQWDDRAPEEEKLATV